MKRVCSLLLDQGLPFGAAELLRNRGWDVLHAEEVGLQTASDHEILERARNEDRCCVTLDQDFHRILSQSTAVSPSVVLVRLQFLKAIGAADLIEVALERIGDQVKMGIAATVTSRGVRVRRLPLRPIP